MMSPSLIESFLILSLSIFNNQNSLEIRVMSRFRFSISPVQVRELTLYTLLRPTPYIVILVLGLFPQEYYQGWGSRKRIYLLRKLSINYMRKQLNPRIMNNKIFTKVIKKGKIQNENSRNPKIPNNKIFTKIIKRKNTKTRIYDIPRL